VSGTEPPPIDDPDPTEELRLEGEVPLPEEPDDDGPIGDEPDEEPIDEEPIDEAPRGAASEEGGPGEKPALPARPDAVEEQGVRRATALMAVGTTLSRATGLLRLFALGYALGTLRLADSYNLANTIPNIVQDIVLGGILSATFVPVFVHRLTTRADDEAWDAVSAVVSVTMIVIAAASIVFLVAVPFIVDAITSLNHSADVAQTRQLAEDLLFLFVPQLTCYGFISVGTALLNARRRFGAPMFTPIANNLVLVAMLLVFGTTVRQASLAGVAAREMRQKARHNHRVVSFRISAELEMKFGKSAKAHRRVRGENPQRIRSNSSGSAYFGGSGSILSRMRTVSSTTVPTISRLFGLSLSTVSCGVWWKTSL